MLDNSSERSFTHLGMRNCSWPRPILEIMHFIEIPRPTIGVSHQTSLPSRLKILGNWQIVVHIPAPKCWYVVVLVILHKTNKDYKCLPIYKKLLKKKKCCHDLPHIHEKNRRLTWRREKAVAGWKGSK